jgi:transcriptional regulator with XRE-family HTH domain
LRAAAGLSGNALAKRMGIVQSRVWKIEHGELLPAEHDLIAWAEATGASSAAAELMDMLQNARQEQAFSQTFRSPGGAAAFEDRIREIEDEAERIGEFQVGVIPGLLHTADYLREIVSLPAGLRTWGADDAGIEAKIAARLRRQEVLTRRGKHVQQVMSEAALRILPTTPATMADQLGKLLAVIRLPSVELGVIPLGQRMPAYALGGFRVYDEDLIVVESITGEKEYRADSEPDEVAAYLEAFTALREAASTGDDAEALIQRALEDLR